MKQTKNNKIKHFTRYILIIVVIWTISVILSLVWNFHKTNDQAYNSAELSAINSLNRDQAMRFWFAKHGGLYSSISNEIQPIAFIKHHPQRDIADLENGNLYTLLDPATILKKMMEEFPHLYKTTVRMVSDFPLNQNNLPDLHEQNVLKQMKRGLKYSNVVKHINGQDTLQVMYPLWGNTSCLICHNQHFTRDDLIGAGGVEIDMAPFLVSANKTIHNLIISHSLIWVLGLFGIIVFYRQVQFWINSHLLLENQLLESHANLELRVKNRTNQLNKLSIAVEGSPAIIIITDSNNHIEYVNPIFSKVSGYNREEIIGNTPAKFSSQLNDSTIYQQMWEDLKNKGVWYGEFRNKRKDGSLYWVSSAISSIFSTTGELQNYIAIQEDITEKKLIEQELITAKEIAETSNKAKSEFISSMSHELRTPLNAIIGFAQLFEFDKTLESKHKNNARKIFSAGNHLLKLVNDILDLSKIESAQLNVNTEPFLYKTLIDESVKLISSFAQSKNISILIKETVNNCTLYADYSRTKQVILNLLSNAIKYSNNNSEICIDCQQMKGGNMRILIMDNGIGIDKENQQQLFEPFNRLGAEQSNIEGTGVGLYICKQLVEMMNGQIGFESDIQTGSVFWFELPTQKTNKIKLEKTTQTGITDQYILYLDSNRANIQLLIQIIEKKDNLALVQADTLEQGIKILKERRDKLPGLIILDINSLGEKIIQTYLQKQRQFHYADIPVIVFGADETYTNLGSGIYYFKKPIDVQSVLNTISTIFSEKEIND